MAPELLTVIVASASCIAFCLVILMLVVVLCRKDPLCCSFRPYRAQDCTEDPPHYHSRHSLIGMTHGAISNQRATEPQLPRRLFIIGKPSDYHLEGPFPRLPSYESVRRNDRQRHIHSMIAQRFGLGGCHVEPPPTYEETFQQSHGVPSLADHLSINSQNDPSSLRGNNRNQPSTAPQGPTSS